MKSEDSLSFYGFPSSELHVDEFAKNQEISLVRLTTFL